MFRDKKFETNKHLEAEEKVPVVNISIINGDSSSFIFPVYNKKDEELVPVELREACNYFKVFVGENVPVGFKVTATFDEVDEEVWNGIRLSIESAIVNGVAEEMSFPYAVPFNLVGDNMESFVHGNIIIHDAPYGRVKEYN